MVRELKKNFPNLKSYHIILLACILSPLLIMNSNYANNQRSKQKLFEEKSKLFDKILTARKLQDALEIEGEISSNLKGSDKVCQKGHEELREYYKTGDLSKIGEKDEGIKCEDKDEKYLQALLNIIRAAFEDGDENKEKRNLLEIDSLKDDVITYSMHLLPIFIFLVIGILTIPAWPICCCCCCCNCCCCCCCKKPKCKIPCFIFTYVFYALSIGICIYGLTQSNSIFVGIADTECSMLKFLDQVLEGENKETLPKWAGIDGINGILEDINEQIDNLRNGTLADLNSQITQIERKKNEFKEEMKESGESFFTSPGGLTYRDDYSDSFSMDDRGINDRYVLDLVKMFGRLKIGPVEEYEPKNSILDLWHQEYKIVSEQADTYLNDAVTNFQTVADNSTGDVLESLKLGQDILNAIKNPFNDIKVEIEDFFVDTSDKIDEYGKLGFKLLFGVLGLINIALGIFVLFICLFSGKMCTNCCCCRCIFKFLTHLLWNILYILMFITFMIGFVFAFIGTIGNDVMSVISFIVSKDNLGEGKDNFIIDQIGPLEIAKDFLDICINGNGSIIDLLNIDTSQLNSFENMTTIEEQINQTRNEFQEKKAFTTYSFYVNQLNTRLNLSELPLLIKEEYAVNLPLGEISENQVDKFLKFDIELRYLNNYITNYGGENNNEKWKINSNSPNECGFEDATDIVTSSEFNPLKCSPYERDWIRDSGTNHKIQNEAKIISGTLKFLNNANKVSNQNSFISKLNNLKNIYDLYLEQYIKALDSSKIILNKITGKLKQYSNLDEGIFSFINGKFIGLNLKVMLKYLKTVLGKDIKTIGICLFVVGCSLALSISSTILLIVIINITIDNNKKKLKKEEKKDQIKDYTLDTEATVMNKYN